MPVTSAVLAPFFELHSPNNRPRLVADVLAEFGHVDVYTTRFDHGSKTWRPDIQEGPYRRVEYVSSPPYSTNVGIARLLSHEVFAARTAARFFRHRRTYDVVYATAPLAELAWFAFRTGRARLNVLDVIDIWPDVLPFSVPFRRATWPIMRGWRAGFNRAVYAADAVLAVSDRFLANARPHFRGPATQARRIYIGGDALPTTGAVKEPILTVAYVGNIGHLYDFDTLVEATADSSVRGRVQVFVIGDGDRRAALLDGLTRRGVPHAYFGSVYEPERLGAILGRCHLGFNGYLNTTAAFSYKANTYLGAGLPLLNSMGGDLWDLVEREGLGYNYAQGDAAGLLSALRLALNGLGERPDRAAMFFHAELSRPVVEADLRAFFASLLTDATF